MRPGVSAALGDCVLARCVAWSNDALAENRDADVICLLAVITIFSTRRSAMQRSSNSLRRLVFLLGPSVVQCV